VVGGSLSVLAVRPPRPVIQMTRYAPRREFGTDETQYARIIRACIYFIYSQHCTYIHTCTLPSRYSVFNMQGTTGHLITYLHLHCGHLP
jgi:hypothetical protein